MKGYQDHFATDYWFSHTARDTYQWPGSTLTYDKTDWYFLGSYSRPMGYLQTCWDGEPSC